MSAKDDAELTALDATITRILNHMTDVKIDSPDYATCVDQLSKLYKMKETETTLQRNLEASRRVSPDTLALIGANLAGIVLILGHERMSVIATKAASLAMKLR